MFNRKSPDVVKETILFLGDAQVGKTSLIKRFINEEFDEKYTPTVEDVYIRQFEINDWAYCIEFLDTSGRYIFPAMRRLNINKATAFVLMISMTQNNSIESLSQMWNDIMEEKEQSIFNKLPLVIVGNKSDILSQRQISESEVNEWAKQHNVSEDKVIFSSSKNENGVWDVFQCLWEQKVKMNNHLQVSARSNQKLFRKTTTEISPTLLQMTPTKQKLNPSRRRFSAFVGITEPKSPRKTLQNSLINSLASSSDRRNSRPSMSKLAQSRGSKFVARSTEIIKLDCTTS